MRFKITNTKAASASNSPAATTKFANAGGGYFGHIAIIHWVDRHLPSNASQTRSGI